MLEERRQAGERRPDLREHLLYRRADLRSADGPAFAHPALMVAAMVVGFLDDRRGGFNEYQLAVLDLAIALGAAMAIYGLQPTDIWLPGWKDTIVLSPWLATPIAAGVIWLAINATNCSDGVDGVSGSLSATAMMLLGGLLYAVLGNEQVGAPPAHPLHRGGRQLGDHGLPDGGLPGRLPLVQRPAEPGADGGRGVAAHRPDDRHAGGGHPQSPVPGPGGFNAAAERRHRGW